MDLGKKSIVPDIVDYDLFDGNIEFIQKAF